MNPDTKEFEAREPGKEIPPEKRHWPVFTLGEKFTLNGVEMEVRKVTRKDVILRPVK